MNSVVRRQRGFTLVESMVAVGIAAVLSSIAYPGFESHVLRARRADALVAMMAAQLAEERHRANHATYGTLADIGVRTASPSGYYALQVGDVAPGGYALLASAVGRQARDASCRHLRLTVADAQLSYASGPDTSVANAADANRRCWSR